MFLKWGYVLTVRVPLGLRRGTTGGYLREDGNSYFTVVLNDKTLTRACERVPL